MRFLDSARLSGVRRTEKEGYLVADAFVARSGIQVYRGSELGLVDRDLIRIYRPPEEVTDVESMKTYSHAPVTLGHPDVNVTKDNWRELARGEVSTEAVWDGNKIRLPLIVKDTEAIEAIEGGVRELSAGYTCDIELVDGLTPDGDAYDAVQRNIRINHVAIVPRGRAGAECRIGDEWGASPVTDAKMKETPMTLRTILVDGLSVETTDAGAQAIEKLQGVIRSLNDKIADDKKVHDAAIAEKDTEIGTLKADNKALKDQAPKPEDLDKMVADRAELVAIAQKVDDKIVVSGRSDKEIRRDVVAASLGDDMVVDASEAQIEGMFRAVKKQIADADPLRTTLKAGPAPRTTDVSDSDKAYFESVRSLETAYQHKEIN